MNRNTLILGAIVAAVGGAVYFATARTQRQLPVAAPPPAPPPPQWQNYTPQQVSNPQPPTPPPAQQAQAGGFNLGQALNDASKFVQGAGALVSNVSQLGNALGSFFGK